MEVIPGVKAKEVVTDLQEVTELKAKIASQKLSQQDEVEHRKKMILDDVVDRLRRLDGPIRVTEEMHELGIAQQVWDMVQQASMALPMMKALRDDDDAMDLDAPGSWID